MRNAQMHACSMRKIVTGANRDAPVRKLLPERREEYRRVQMAVNKERGGAAAQTLRMERQVQSVHARTHSVRTQLLSGEQAWQAPGGRHG